MRSPLILATLLLLNLSTACDKDNSCSTDDDCFAGERCVKAAGAASGSCDRGTGGADMSELPDAQMNDLGETGRDMMNKPDMPGEADMQDLADMADLPLPADTLDACLRQGCEAMGGSCVAADGKISCAIATAVLSCLTQDTLLGLHPEQPVRAVSMMKGSDLRAVVIAGNASIGAGDLVTFTRSEALSTTYKFTMPGAASVGGLATYDLDAQSERVVLAASYMMSAQRLLSLRWLPPGGAARELLDSWSPEINHDACGVTGESTGSLALCDGAALHMRAAPRQQDDMVADLLIATCLTGGVGDTNALIQVRPGDPTQARWELMASAKDTCDATSAHALSTTELNASLSSAPNVSASSGHVWTLEAGSAPVAHRQDWRGSDDLNAGVSAAQLEFPQHEPLNDVLLLGKVRAACSVDAAAQWSARAESLLLGSTLNRDEFVYFGEIAGRAIVVRHHLSSDTTTVTCPRAWQGLRWVSAVQAEDGWLAVGKKADQMGVVVMRGVIDGSNDDYAITSVINAGEELEPLALVRHRDKSASLVVRKDTQVSHVYLSDEGAPLCP